MSGAKSHQSAMVIQTRAPGTSLASLQPAWHTIMSLRRHIEPGRKYDKREIIASTSILVGLIGMLVTPLVILFPTVFPWLAGVDLLPQIEVGWIFNFAILGGLLVVLAVGLKLLMVLGYDLLEPVGEAFRVTGRSTRSLGAWMSGERELRYTSHMINGQRVIIFGANDSEKKRRVLGRIAAKDYLTSRLHCSWAAKHFRNRGEIFICPSEMQWL